MAECEYCNSSDGVVFEYRFCELTRIDHYREYDKCETSSLYLHVKCAEEVENNLRRTMLRKDNWFCR